MGCPEWEDADFNGTIKNHFTPDWTKVDLKGFQRPRWFAQGPLVDCINYLISKHGSDNNENKLWKKLELLNKTRIPEKLIFSEKIKEFFIKMIGLLKSKLFVLFNFIFRENKSTKSIYGLYGKIRKEYIMPRFQKFVIIENIVSFFALIFSILFFLFFKPAFSLYCTYSDYRSKRFMSRSGYSFNSRIRFLVDAYQKAFPHRKDILEVNDFQYLFKIILKWRKLISNYDIVQAYSTDPIIPLLADKPYFAFEHGTIRDIPFQQTFLGRSTSLSYNMAEHVFVTNFDCLESAEQLCPDRYTLVNHPYDEDRGMAISDWMELRKNLCKLLDCRFILFFPTRHDWVLGTGYADKANDIFLKAFCKSRGNGVPVGLVCCCWGANIEESKKLLNSMNCTQYVHWTDPMGIIAFERMARASHCVVDQFKLGAFGGVVFKAMAVGSPILTYLDKQRILKQYNECPPVINCSNEEEIIKQISLVAEDPNILASIGEKSREWMKKYHSKKDTINAQLSCYGKFFDLYTMS